MGTDPVQTHIERTTTDRQTDKWVSTYNHLPAEWGQGGERGISHCEWAWEDRAVMPQPWPCPEAQSLAPSHRHLAEASPPSSTWVPTLGQPAASRGPSVCTIGVSCTPQMFPSSLTGNLA